MRCRDFRRRAIAVFVVSLLFGCAASKELKSEERKSIHTIYVDGSAPLPKEPLIMTRGGLLLGAFTGGIGAAITSTDKSDEQLMIEYLSKNKIEPAQLLTDAFTREIAGRKVFALAPTPMEADVVVKIEILVYGISPGGTLLSSGYRTLLNSKATMITSNGTILWTKQVIDAATNDDRPEATFEELCGNPETMRTHMTIVTQVAAREMVNHLAGSM